MRVVTPARHSSLCCWFTSTMRIGSPKNFTAGIILAVMAGHSRPKDGVASLAYVPATPVNTMPTEAGYPQQVRA